MVIEGSGGIAFTSQWAKDHPTDAWLLSQELQWEARQEEARLRSCSMCYWWFSDGPFKTGQGLCCMQSDMENFDFLFCDCTETCEGFEPLEDRV